MTPALRDEVRAAIVEYITTAYASYSKTEPVITGREILGYLKQHRLDTSLTLACTRQVRSQLVTNILRTLVRQGVLETSLASGRTGAEVRAYSPGQGKRKNSLAGRYCGPCDEYTPFKVCRKCGADTDKVPS